MLSVTPLSASCTEQVDASPVAVVAAELEDDEVLLEAWLPHPAKLAIAIAAVVRIAVNFLTVFFIMVSSFALLMMSLPPSCR